MKRQAFLYILVFSTLILPVSYAHAFPWWTTPAAKWAYSLLLSTSTPEKILEKALTSNDPEKVEMCLDRMIEQKNYIYISRIKLRVENKIRDIRKEFLLSQTPIDPKKIQKELKPWIRVREKAQYFFTRKQSPQTDMK